jgi:hypothetical protein
MRPLFDASDASSAIGRASDAAGWQSDRVARVRPHDVHENHPFAAKRRKCGAPSRRALTCPYGSVQCGDSRTGEISDAATDGG